MKITLLGTGTSVGIPSLGQLGWGKCNPKNPKNKRQRCAVLIQSKNTNILIDAGPDIKNQLIGHNLMSLDAIIITHEHADHISGLDELRPFYFPKQEKINIYTIERTANFLLNRFDYLFNKNEKSQSYFKPPMNLNILGYYDEINFNDINIKTIKQHHGVINTIGLIINDKFAYCTDVVDFPDDSFNKLKNLDTLVITGLRSTPHIAHAHFDLSFSWINKLNPKKAYLTHLSPDSDHDSVLSLCPDNVEPAYDNMSFDI
ncbi:MAG: MBL fold metallo-hydrolase [Candidatus Puniceispirillales bacterium]|tara:strand:- start:1666 stop:2442 length:777 start_codon:yes stop_codon:yes gene_type:complete